MHQLLSILVQRLLRGHIHYLVLPAGDGGKVDSDGQRKSSGKTKKSDCWKLGVDPKTAPNYKGQGRGLTMVAIGMN